MSTPTPPRKRISRRTLLIGGAGLVAIGAAAVLGVEEDVIPGRTTLYRALGLNGPVGTIPRVAPGPQVTGSFVSQARLGKTVNWAISYPPGMSSADRLPVLISLHGVNGNHMSSFGNHLGLDRFLAQAVAEGHSPFAIASIDGGNSYWHKRSSGEDSAAMVTDEFPHILSTNGLDVSRVGLMGWSMGGFGALHIGGLLGVGGTRVVIAESPALWQSVGASARGAFDGQADFAANSAFGRQAELDGIATRIDCGIGDGFYPQAEKYVAGFRTKPAGGFEPGGHNDYYWRRMAPAQLAFAAKHLA